MSIDANFIFEFLNQIFKMDLFSQKKKKKKSNQILFDASFLNPNRYCDVKVGATIIFIVDNETAMKCFLFELNLTFGSEVMVILSEVA